MPDDGGQASNIQIDTGQYDVTVKPKLTPEALQSQLKREERTYYLLLGLLVVAWLVAAWIAFFKLPISADAAPREWARTVFTAILAGFVGFVFAKK